MGVRLHPSTAPGVKPDAQHELTMRFVNIYLIGYFILVLGAVLALWQAGILARISATWVAIGALIAIGLGIMLAVSAGKPEISRE